MDYAIAQDADDTSWLLFAWCVNGKEKVTGYVEFAKSYIGKINFTKSSIHGLADYVNFIRFNKLDIQVPYYREVFTSNIR